MDRTFETPSHLYPSALVADADGGDAPAFELPADLTVAEVTDADLARLEQEAQDAFDAIRAGDLTPEAIGHLTQLADAVDAVRAEAERRLTVAGEAADTAAALEQRMRPVASAGDDDAPGDGDAPAEDAPAEDAPASEAEPTGTPELVTASGRRAIRVPLSAVRAAAPAPAHSATPTGVSLVAAADVPGVPAGGALADTRQLAGLMHARARSLGNKSSALIASIEVDYDHVVDEGSSRGQMIEAMEAARNPASLVAAGGWCAPSDRMWEFFGIEDVSGLWDVPTVGVARGGIEFPVSPSIADVLSAPWLWTETDDIAALANDGDPLTDVTKPCFRIPCGTFGEVRLRAHGVCITHGNLSDAAWPEQTRRFIDLVMAAHAHVMNQRNLARLVALSNAVTIGATLGAAAPLLAAIELQVMDYRDKFRMSESALLEGVFDSWVPGVIRADISRRSGIPIEEVPTSRIEGWFGERGVRPQWVQDFHPLQTLASPAGDGFREVWPANITFALYAAGTFVHGKGTTIDLGVSRDSAQNATNDHTAVWTEEADLIAKLGHESRLVTVPVIPNGYTSAPQNLAAATLA